MAFSQLVHLTVFAFLVAAAAAGSPVDKVVKLLEDLKTEVEGDATKEAASYGKYACFCQDTTKEKAGSITDGEDKINTLSGSIGKDTASKEEKELEVKTRKEEHEKLGASLTEVVSRCSAGKAEYEAGQADMTKALDSLNRAIKAMKAKKAEIGLMHKKGKVTPKSFLELDQDVQRGLALAGIDPSDPAYKYHAKEIDDILAKLLKDFEGQKQDGADKHKISETACAGEKDGLNTKMKDNLVAISAAEEKIDELAKKIAKDRGDLIEAQEQLEDDEVYLKQLTTQCEAKAKDFDQRASQRNDEVSAISQALEILTNKVSDAASVNKYLLVQSKLKGAVAKPLSFLQAPTPKAVTNFLARAGLSVSEQAMQNRVVDIIRLEGSKLGSTELSMLAMHINGVDHFKEVKGIIQKLIENLLDEEKAESSKKGFCDTEIAKAKKDRDHTQAKATSMSTELKSLEATKEELEAEIKKLGEEIVKAQDALKEAAGLRKDEKVENEATLSKAQEGLDALRDAILILKAFYSQASRARVFLQAGPVDDDTSGPGFSGAYKGKQVKSRAIFELLETIEADFVKTIKSTEQSEADAAAAFVELDRTSKADIASKETKTKLDEQDLKSTENSIENTLDDLKSTMSLQGDALKMLESLKPSCLAGTSYEERTSKRKEEIKALNFAMCILTEGKKEEDCKSA